jgi:hypothetical protein
MAGINTNTLLLIGAAGVALYFVTRPRVPALPVGYNPYAAPGYGAPAYNPYATQPNPLAQQITAGGSALEGLSDLLGNFF